MTLTENLSVGNRCHRKWLLGCTSLRGHGAKSTPLFLPAGREASWLLLPGSVSLLSGGTMQPENTYSCILKVTCQAWECRKRINTDTATTSIYLPIRHICHDTITRRVANQGLRGTLSPWGGTGPAGHQPSILIWAYKEWGYTEQYFLFLLWLGFQCHAGL